MINPFQKTYSTQELNLFRFLEKVDLFKELSDKEMALFLPYMHERDYKSNEVVFFRGDPSQALYVVKKGRVTLNIDIKDRFEVLTEISSNYSYFHDNYLFVCLLIIVSHIVWSIYQFKATIPSLKKYYQNR